MAVNGRERWTNGESGFRSLERRIALVTVPVHLQRWIAPMKTSTASCTTSKRKPQHIQRSFSWKKSLDSICIVFGFTEADVLLLSSIEFTIQDTRANVQQQQQQQKTK